MKHWWRQPRRLPSLALCLAMSVFGPATLLLPVKSVSNGSSRLWYKTSSSENFGKSKQFSKPISIRPVKLCRVCECVSVTKTFWWVTHVIGILMWIQKLAVIMHRKLQWNWKKNLAVGFCLFENEAVFCFLITQLRFRLARQATADYSAKLQPSDARDSCLLSQTSGKWDQQ